MAVAKKKTTKKSATSSKNLMAKLKAKQAVLNKSRAKEAPSGFMKDDEIIKALGLTDGKGIVLFAQIRAAKIEEYEGTPILKINFTVTEGEHKGTPIQKSIWLPLDDDDKLEKAFDDFCFLLQKLGYGTDDLKVDQIEQLASELTEEKPYCKIYVGCNKATKGKSKGKMFLNVRVNSSYDPEDLEEDEEEEPEEEDEEEGDDTDSEEDYEESEESDDESDDESDEESEEEEEDSEDTEDDFDEEDPSTWVGCTCKTRPKGLKKDVEALVTKFIKKTNSLQVKAGSKTYTISVDEVKDWV